MARGRRADDRDGRRRARARPEDPFRIHRWHHRDPADPRRPGTRAAGSSGALRSVALRSLGGRRELQLAPSVGTLAQWEFRRLQDDRTGCRRLRELPAGEQGPHRSRTAGRQDARALAQRRSPGALPRHGFPSRGHHPGRVEQLRIRKQRRLGRPPRAALPCRLAHPPLQPARPAGRRPGKPRGEQQRSPPHPPRHAVRTGRTIPTVRTTAPSEGSLVTSSTPTSRISTNSC